MLSTEFESYLVTNNVLILAGEFNLSASVTTRIRPIIGSTLAFGEHGTGDYQAEEKLTYNSVSISAERNILAGFFSGLCQPLQKQHSPARELVGKAAGRERLQRHSLER